MNRKFHDIPAFPQQQPPNVLTSEYLSLSQPSQQLTHGLSEPGKAQLNDIQNQVDVSAALLDEIKKLNISSRLLTSAISKSYHHPSQITPLSQHIHTSTSAPPPTVLPALAKNPDSSITTSNTVCFDENTHGQEVEAAYLFAGSRSTQQTQEKPDCLLFLRGRCHYGMQCKYNHRTSHDLQHRQQQQQQQQLIYRSASSNKSTTSNSEGRRRNSNNKYPLRPDAADCQYYLKTGRCNYGPRCRFNHPHRDQDLVDALNRRDCFDFVKTGTCPYGIACKYNHPPLAFVKSPGSSVTHSSSSSVNGSSTVKDAAQVEKIFPSQTDDNDGLIAAALARLQEQSRNDLQQTRDPVVNPSPKKAVRSQVCTDKMSVCAWRERDAVAVLGGPDTRNPHSREKCYSPLYSNHLFFHSQPGRDASAATWGQCTTTGKPDPWATTSSINLPDLPPRQGRVVGSGAACVRGDVSCHVESPWHTSNDGRKRSNNDKMGSSLYYGSTYSHF